VGTGPIVLQRGEGEPLSIGEMTLLVGREEWTSGAYSVMDQIMAPRLLSAVHAHAAEDQVAFVLDGTMSCWIDGEEFEVATGGYALRPAGLPHSMWNATAAPVRFLEITSPATRFQEYMGLLSELIDGGGANPTAVAALAQGYGITFFPDQTERLSAQLGMAVGGFWK
jgi:mannose-6-phosphate isomerase-like protein (cupin superfamily)